MSDTRKNRMPSLDAALRDWPDAAAVDWNARAEAVMADLGRPGEDGVDLLAAPVLAEDDAPPVSSKADRVRDRQKLKDLAKLAQGLTPAPAPTGLAKGDDSGIVDLAAASAADPGAAARAQTTPLASQSLFDDVTPARPASMPPATGTVRLGAIQPVQVIRRIKPAEKPRNGVVAAIGGFLALGGVAAGALLYMHGQKEAPPTPVAVVTTATATAAPSTPPPAETAAPTASNAGADLSSLPSVAASPTGHRHAKKVDDDAVASNAKPARTGNDRLMPPPVGPTGDLDKAMRGAAGSVDDSSSQRPAAAASMNSSVPQRPSQGAVTGALGAVLPAARSCLGPDDPISRASVVFNSDGSVQSVTVTGGAMGKPAEGCIKDKLKAARLQPFAEPTYTANITVRHN